MIRRTSSKFRLSETIGVDQKNFVGTNRLYSKKTDPKTVKRRNLGTFATLEKAKEHERAVQYFKRKG